MKKILCFAGFADNELPLLRGAASAGNSAWECHFVADAPAALALLAAQPFDALVADMNLPGKSGAELLREVRALHPHTLGFIVGNVRDQELIINCIGGTHQFIRRPFQPAKLVATLQRGLKLDAWLANDEMRKLVPRLQRMPSLPATYFNLLKEIESDSVTTQNVGTVIARDPMVTARLLQMVNSAAFALVQKVTDPLDAVAVLGIFDIAHEARGKGGNVHIVGRRVPEDMRVAHPAKPLVTPRAIGGNAHEVGALAPQPVLPQALRNIAAQCQFAGFGKVAVDDDAGKILGTGRGIKSRHLDVAKPVIGEARLKGFARRVAPQCIDVGCARAA